MYSLSSLNKCHKYRIPLHNSKFYIKRFKTEQSWQKK